MISNLLLSRSKHCNYDCNIITLAYARLSQAIILWPQDFWVHREQRKLKGKLLFSVQGVPLRANKDYVIWVVGYTLGIALFVSLLF